MQRGRKKRITYNKSKSKSRDDHVMTLDSDTPFFSFPFFVGSDARCWIDYAIHGASVWCGTA